MSETRDEIVSLVFSNMTVMLPRESGSSEDVRRFWRATVQERTPELQDGKKVLKFDMVAGQVAYRQLDDDVEHVEEIRIDPVPFSFDNKVRVAGAVVETDVLLEDLKANFDVADPVCQTFLGSKPHQEIEIVVDGTLYILTIMYILEKEAKAEFSLES